MKNIILIDETVHRIDKLVTRISFACVEITDKNLNKALSELASLIDDEKTKIETKNANKLHFSEITNENREKIIELIYRLPLKIKVYTYYFSDLSEKQAKIQGLSKTVGHITWLHRNIKPEILVEKADEYKGMDINAKLVKDELCFLLPDAFLSVYSKHLNDTSTSIKSHNEYLYNKIKEKIRLQTYFSDGFKEFYTREKRI
jgi:hypothetical protein